MEFDLEGRGWGKLKKREFKRVWEMLWLIPLIMNCYGLQVFI